jgi:hypothetical protein
MAKKTEEKKKKWYELHEEIPGVVARGKEHNLSTFTFGPYEWHMDFGQLLQLSGGNQQFVDEVKGQLEDKDVTTDVVTPRTWQRVKVLRIPTSHVTELEKIAVVLDQGASVTRVIGPVGRDWSKTFSLGKLDIQIMSEML